MDGDGREGNEPLDSRGGECGDVWEGHALIQFRRLGDDEVLLRTVLGRAYAQHEHVTAEKRPEGMNPGVHLADMDLCSRRDHIDLHVRKSSASLFMTREPAEEPMILSPADREMPRFSSTTGSCRGIRDRIDTRCHYVRWHPRGRAELASRPRH